MGNSHNHELLLQKIFCWPQGADVTMKGFSAFFGFEDWDLEISS